MTTAEKTGTIAKCYTHHLAEGLTHEEAVAHIATGLGITTEAVHFAIHPVLKAAALAKELAA